MFSVFRDRVCRVAPCILFTLLLAGSLCAANVSQTTASQQQEPVLRVCADPNNLPFSNDRLEGFENRIAELMADDLDTSLSFVWRAQRRGYFREMIKSGKCDIVLGVPEHLDMALTTKPYYYSSYSFVSSAEKGYHLKSLDDPLLKKVQVGVELIGDDGANSPPAHALARRNIIQNVVGFSVYGDYSQPNPPARIVDAVASGKIDIGLVWGPLAGYFALHEPIKLNVQPIGQSKTRDLPFVFGISMGVRHGNSALRDKLNGFIDRRKPDIDRILDEFGVPRVAAPGNTRRPEND
jgi:quinoprotein dehydrogenase-associated probable ABC transporter substrate-binding protein